MFTSGAVTTCTNWKPFFVREHATDEVEDLESLIYLGKLEHQT